MMNNSKSKNSENFKMKIVLLPESTKTQEWLIKFKSEQLECLKLKEQFIRSSAEKCNDLAPEDKTELDKYVHIHQELTPLKQDIEANGFKLNTQMLSKVKTQSLNKAKSDNHWEKLDKNFNALELAIDGNQKLNTKISLIGTRTHRITTRRFNVQGLSKEVKQLILPTQFNKVFMIDFKAFEPSVLAYLANDNHLKEYLNGSQGLYDTLLNNLSLPAIHRKLVKCAFIGSFLFGGNYMSDKFKLNQYISEDEWNKAMSKFSNVIKLKEQIDNKKTVKMPYGITHDMKHCHGSSIMALYVQTSSSYIFKNILWEVYQHQCDQEDFRIMLPIHDAIMIECNTNEVAEHVRQLMETSANRLFGDNFAHTTIEQMGGNHDDK
ncbi:DNA polymerase [Staphylococcus auricularis]|uniref:DNA polymerase n=1 Tax=Staphylococcus auricularis TaxID=29379 RepID=UPI00242A9134|nr:DNA polymerase [Staphylococcus auricularis]